MGPYDAKDSWNLFQIRLRYLLVHTVQGSGLDTNRENILSWKLEENKPDSPTLNHNLKGPRRREDSDKGLFLATSVSNSYSILIVAFVDPFKEPLKEGPAP